MAQVISLQAVRDRRLPVKLTTLPPEVAPLSHQEVMCKAVDTSLADKVERWAQSLLRDLEKFSGQLTSPQRKELLAVVGIIDKHPPQP